MKTETHIPFHCQNWEKMDDDTKAAVVKMVELAYNHVGPPKPRLKLTRQEEIEAEKHPIINKHFL